jgi:hypothetical protein
MYKMYASAQSLDFLDLAKNSSFLDWELVPMPITKRLIYEWKLIDYDLLVRCHTGLQ